MAKHEDYPLKKLSYYQTGGFCRELYLPESVDELCENVAEIRQKNCDSFVLGGGTNSLVSDEYWDGVVIAFSGLKQLSFQDDLVWVQAGVENSQLARACLERKLEGTAWMYRLPGQIGGTVRMNARCYGGEISQIVSEVVSVDPSGQRKHYQNVKNLFKGYKDTVFMSNRELVAEVKLSLKSIPDSSSIEKTMKACEYDREKKGQFLYPSCGCVFKNNYDVGIPSGLLLERAGLKGQEHGGAVVSPQHANFVYNREATSREIIELTLIMRDRVYRQFGVWLDYEMEILGNIPLDLKKELTARRAPAHKESLLAPLRQQFHSGFLNQPPAQT